MATVDAGDSLKWVGPRRSSGAGDAVAMGLLAIGALLLFARVLFTDRILLQGDILGLWYPQHHLWAEAIRHGEIPLWNPYAAAGRPWLADAQLSVLYPTMLLHVMLALPRALAVELVLHLWAAAAFMYVFLRRGHLPPAAAFFGAASFAFGGFVIAHTHHVSMVRTLTWMPLLLLWARESPSRPWPQIAPRLAIPVALSLLAGHLQIVLFSLTLGVLLAVYSAVTGASATWGVRRVPRALAGICLGTGLGMLLGAVVLIPAYEMAQLSARAGGRLRTPPSSRCRGVRSSC